MKEKRCKHGVIHEGYFCVRCKYPSQCGKHDLSPNEENPRDLVDDIKKSEYKKLKDYYGGL